MNRWDICYGSGMPTIQAHFCREWDSEGGGCYGTNPDHGYTWEEARLQVARWHLNAANEWIREPEPDSQHAEVA